MRLARCAVRHDLAWCDPTYRPLGMASESSGVVRLLTVGFALAGCVPGSVQAGVRLSLQNISKPVSGRSEHAVGLSR